MGYKIFTPPRIIGSPKTPGMDMFASHIPYPDVASFDRARGSFTNASDFDKNIVQVGNGPKSILTRGGRPAADRKKADCEVDSGSGALARLELLAQRFATELVILGGIDETAVKNNLAVVESIKAAGARLDNRHDSFFGIVLGGSRIKGYNTDSSDIDIVVVRPDSTSDTGFVYDAIDEELALRDVARHVDKMLGAWAEHPISCNAHDFIYQVDHMGGELIALFSPAQYQNPNLLLGRLAALEIIRKYENYEHWEYLESTYRMTYLGDRVYMVNTLAQRFDLPLTQVGKIFSKSLFRDRYRKFGLGKPKAMYKDLKVWYQNNQQTLAGYRMNQLYTDVLDLMDSGF